MELVKLQDSARCYRHSTAGPVEILICSTPPSRRLLTDPELVGSRYTRLLREAVRAALEVSAAASPRLRQSVTEHRSDVLNILRGGLTFDIGAAVEELFGPAPGVSFVGTVRKVDAPVQLDYERWELTGEGVLIFGDIVATGSTTRAALSAALTRYEMGGRPLKHVVVVTIGAGPGVAALVDLLAAAAVPATIVVLEAIFNLPEPGVDNGFPQAPYDFLRGTRSSAPEYEWARLTSPASLLEKCAVYDGGMRAFSPTEHIDYRQSWWRAFSPDADLGHLARVTAGLDAFGQPFPEWRDTAAPAAQSPTVSPEELYQAGRQVWDEMKEGRMSSYVEQNNILSRT